MPVPKGHHRSTTEPRTGRGKPGGSGTRESAAIHNNWWPAETCTETGSGGGGGAIGSRGIGDTRIAGGSGISAAGAA
ncbi:hypothetical protein KRR38_02550 [Novosphingobium sp. G106]|uniref:hypothetical protein n=1 Tax=Novosphingobium sp. G106 TaxID=2849500 RepID=UPI001C2CFA31|nr:hypothetical protein [Novosphingobium sp. G106]MBV1686577.1 hypothetical protein [Novosphingobium sp. G106]